MDISNTGLVVGGSQTADGRSHATIWDNGAIINLDPGWGYGIATAIDPSGTYVVGGFSAGAPPVQYRPMRWTRSQTP